MLDLLIPDEEQVKKDWHLSCDKGIAGDFPFWTRLWPSSMALAGWLQRNDQICLNKNILELAAGLGLPSFTVASIAKSVVVSDYLPEAIEQLNRNICHLHLSNVVACLQNWHDMPELIPADVLLLSDVNYNPTDFEVIENLIIRYLELGTTIVLSTPHRISAAAFAEKVLKLQPREYLETVLFKDEKVPITIWLFQSQNLSNSQVNIKPQEP